MNPSLAAMFAQAALMVLLPIVLWSRLIKRLGLGRHGWATVGYGCLFFILGQIVQTPFRIGAVSLGLAATLAGGWLFALIAGLGEESMRYVAMRWVGQIRERLDRPTAIAYGLGHGGFESLALGLGVLATAFLIRDAFNPATAASVPEALAAQARVVAETPPYVFLGGVVERVLAIGLHVGLSLIVMRAVLTRSLAPLGLAIAWHAVANGVAVTLQSAGVSGLLIEGWIAVAAAAALYYGLRAPDGETWARS